MGVALWRMVSNGSRAGKMGVVGRFSSRSGGQFPVRAAMMYPYTDGLEEQRCLLTLKLISSINGLIGFQPHFAIPAICSHYQSDGCE